MSTGRSPYKTIDGSVPISSLLYNGEELVASQEGVGLYDGKEKTLGRQNGTVHLTTHRIIYVDLSRPRTNSLSLSLAAIRQSEYYAGFLSSSAKVTVYLKESSASISIDNEAPSRSSTDSPLALVDDATDVRAAAWICPVCSYSNPSAATEDSRPKCILCGVPRDPRAYAASPSLHPPPSVVHRSPSLPTLRHPSPLPLDTVPSSPVEDSELPIPTTDATGLNPCPVCTYLNHRSMKYCEMCGTALPSMASPRAVPSRSSGSTPMPSSISLPTTSTLRVSFRKGGDKPFYNHLKRVMTAKAWGEGSTTPGTRGDIVRDGNQTLRLGIQGIFETMDLNARAADTNLQGSLHDLEVLMAKAKEMVELASSLNSKLTAQEEELARRKAMFPDLPNSAARATEPEEATFIRSSLAQLGLPTVAVTQDMVKDENTYHEELAKELAGVLTGRRVKGKGLMGSGEAIIGLDEVWGGWNRARGIALVPPSSLLMAATYLPRYTSPPVTLRVFRSGLRVLHTPKYSDASFSAQVIHILSSSPHTSATTVDIANHERLSVGLAEEMIDSVEGSGAIVRDEGGANEQARWWANIMDMYEWDGQPDIDQ